MSPKRNIVKFSLIIFFYSLLAQEAFARGGGGGSGGGGGGGGFGGGGFGGGGVGYGSTGGGNPIGLVALLVFVVAFLVLAKVSGKVMKKNLDKREQNNETQLEAEHVDAAALKQRVEDIFYKFQQAWSGFDVAAMQPLLTDSYYKRMVLELNVLQNEKRQDLMEDTKLLGTWIYNVAAQDAVSVRIYAVANDKLIDTQSNQQLFLDTSAFTEYWHFLNVQGVWKLNLITQETENPALSEPDIAAFAQKNGFFYDPDFGWLMMPDKGVLFSQTNFGTSDINNHVIGYYRNKIVEFYTYIPKPKNNFSDNYLIAQAILPISYKNILIKKKQLLAMPPWNLKKVSLEWPDFNNKFSLWADAQDQVSSLELLTPNFMEKIYNLPYELNIEIVGNTLYFYTKDKGATSYDSMLEALSWAFDEMKM